SPRNQSRASWGSQCFCLQPTKDHFSSSCTLCVSGGKGHQLVVEALGVRAGGPGQPADRVLVDADQTGGLADAAAVGQVPEGGQELVTRQAGVEEGRGLVLGEAVLAGAAVEQAVLLADAVAGADGQVALAAPAVQGAGGALAAEAAEVVHARSKGWSGLQVSLTERGTPFNDLGTPPGHVVKPIVNLLPRSASSSITCHSSADFFKLTRRFSKRLSV